MSDWEADKSITPAVTTGGHCQSAGIVSYGLNGTNAADREPRQKFDVKSDEGIFLGYSRNSRALRVYNKRTQIDVKSAFLNRVVQEEVYVEQPKVSLISLIQSMFIDSKRHFMDSSRPQGHGIKN
ncbi:hypothetical protein LIER_19557 [Lithospermum erythrorhizon]|uniref:Retroviral polymerase SH3-like domain-containing protein n=1 Tax=Lithospermum erythrorhizon TaxID=34254 RepID=A0AAV3QI73_LITER